MPPRETIDAVACANASGYSARMLGLPDPEFTVVTAVLTSGKPADEHSLQRLAGLRTRTLFHIRRPKADRGGPIARLVSGFKLRRMTARELRRRLSALGYGYERLVSRPARWYHELVLSLCAHDPEVRAAIARKQPSTGLIAVALGLADGRFDRVVMAGFDFTLTHAYGANPLIAERGSVESAHAPTDVTILRCLAHLRSDLFTSEPVVHARAGVPLIARPTLAGELA